jgi:hypothetical protein
MCDTIAEIAEHHHTPPTKLLVAAGGFFAYEPVLRCLQGMSVVPFAEEIVNSMPSQGQSIFGNNTSDAESEYYEDDEESDYGRKKGSFHGSMYDQLDKSQKEAFDLACQKRVSLIQGPPGTGETYIGVALAKHILEATQETILCVCYTNHALDDFLEDLINAGVDGVVRIGGRSKSPIVQNYNLRELASDRFKFSKSQNRRYAALHSDIEEFERDIARLSKVCSREIGEKWWRTVAEHLEDFDPESLHQLQCGPGKGKEEHVGV